jgi:bifunctional non-homologous end joining protein LigD
VNGADLMKAVLTDGPFDEPGWVFERKLDGIRCLAVKDGDAVTLLSRNDLPLTGRYPEIAAAVGRQERSFALDGEVVAFDGEQTSFGRLARRGHESVDVYYFVFDILTVDGEDLRPLPLLERKSRLRDALRFDDPLRFEDVLQGGTGEQLFAEACRRGWEGLIAKRVDSPYVARRSKDWLKVKCGREQELVIGGYTEPRGTRTGFGALLLGVYDGDRLVYAGKVGTGFDRATLGELMARMALLQRSTSPFAAGDPPRLRTTWIEPELVAQVGFTEWTADGRLRHPKFVGLREDKAAHEVVREDAAAR